MVLTRELLEKPSFGSFPQAYLRRDSEGDLDTAAATPLSLRNSHLERPEISKLKLPGNS